MNGGGIRGGAFKREDESATAQVLLARLLVQVFSAGCCFLGVSFHLFPSFAAPVQEGL